MRHGHSVQSSVQAYIDAIPVATRPLFDRVDALVRGAFPEVETVLSYKMPTYVVGARQLHVGAWKHGLSFYGWDEGQDGGFASRHPELSSGRGTLRLPPSAAADISDEELLALIAGALGASDAPPA